jgi:regulation of enolase protein 1 (concanavalin A-like superfamily)
MAGFLAGTVPPASGQTFGIYRELWTGLNWSVGNSLTALTNTAYNPAWPNSPNPSYTAVYTTFNVPMNIGDHYGQRLRTFVVPPTNGAYTFWISSDDTSELYLSSDESADHAVRIAFVSTATGYLNWGFQASQQSTPVTLQANRRYYIEAIMQEGEGDDYLTVRWQLPEGTIEEPMSTGTAAGTLLIPCSGVNAMPGLYRQPTNMTILEKQNVFFSVLVTNPCPVAYQWRCNGTNVTGFDSTGSQLWISNAPPSLAGAYTCVVSNSAGAATSAVATLTILADTTPPFIVRAFNVGTNNVQVVFSEPIEALSATNLSNYAFTNGLALTAASLAADAISVNLRTGPLVCGSNYVLLVNGVRDQAGTPNLIAPNSSAGFIALDYVPQDIGSPTPAGSIVSIPNGYSIVGGGADIGGVRDSFQFGQAARAGDFDVRVRLNSFSQTDVYAKAGLMARESLAVDSRFAAVFATPSIRGSIFESRSTTGGNAVTTGNFQVNYPDSWLRLQRVGNQFTGYAGYDGQNWQQLGTVTLAMTDPISFGMAVSSHDTNQTALAQFLDLSTVTSAGNSIMTPPGEPLGPSSRRTGLVISEIMYHPQSRTDGRNLEFIEILNTQPYFEDIGGYSISGDVSFTFPPGTRLVSGAYLVVAAAPADVQAVYGIQNVTGPYTNNLSNSSGQVRLRNKIGAVLLEVNYDSLPPWPAAPDGTGHSLVLARPSFGEDSPGAWAASDRKGGSPGSPDGTGAEPARGVVINEFLAHTDLPDVDAIELFNCSTQAVDLSGCWLTDSAATNKFRIPDGTSIPARGYWVFDENALGFGLDAAGEAIYLVNAADTRVLDAVRYEAQANGISFGRCPDGAGTFRTLAAKTLGAANSAPLSPDIVINEIMYDPIGGSDEDQYVELYNKGSTAVDLGGWKFTAGISYTFPSNTTVAPGGYLVVAKNASRMLAHYGNLTSANLKGDFSGSLAHKGERLALARPDLLIGTDAGGRATTNTIYVVENEVTYGTGGRWGQWSHGGGSSLELIDPRSDNSLAANWADSDETAKSSWTNVEATGVLDLGDGSYSPSQLQMFLEGEGECLVDNVEVFASGGANRISNPNFDSGTSGWVFQGTQCHSTLESTNGYGSSGPCLHLRSTGRGDPGPNRIRTVLSTSLASGNTATLRAKVRWLKGNPEILLRLLGNWLDVAGQMPLPLNLGSPGARNSRYAANAGPSISETTHKPILPASGQPVVVSARINDPDGIGTVTLKYRNDTTSGSTVSVTMLDNGTGGDQMAGDGVYSATIPGQTAGNIIAFYVEASDDASTPVTIRFPADAPTRECLVGFGESTVPGVFGNYRTWVTKANISTWTSREKDSNDPLDATFVYGDFRVVYNAQTYYSGSPFKSYNSPLGTPCDYAMSLPDDDRAFGANDFVIATLGNAANDPTALREQTAFWILNQLEVPSLYRRYVYMYLNGSSRGMILEDAQQPSSDVVQEYFPDDSDGNLHKIEDWFEFNDTDTSFTYNTATLDEFTTTGGAKKTARYRWNWRPRAVKGSSSDFTNLFLLVDAVHTSRPDPYTAQVASFADVEEWMRTFAVERLVGNWDSFSYGRGKNMYAYKPERGRWTMLAYDIDDLFGSGYGQPTSELFGGEDASVDTMRAFPPFVRAYWRGFQNAVDGPLQDSQMNPLLDAKYAALVANGVPVSDSSSIKSFVTQRRAYLVSQLATVASSFSVSSTVTVTGNSAVLTGTAPVTVNTILINGVAFPVTWTGVNSWTATVPLQPGTNPLSVVGVDGHNQPITGCSNQVSAVYSGASPSPAGQVVINEIMYQPAVSQADFVELYNTSTNLAFDLSGWQFNGLSYTFPAGALLGPSAFLVLASDRAAFAGAYGITLPVFDVFAGNLQTNGETLTLIQPGTNAHSDAAVAKVRYENVPPWPTNSSQYGSSLQLIDAQQDNWRVGNWAAVQPAAPTAPQWVYVTASGTASSSTLYMYLQSAGDICIDDLKLVAGTVPEAGANALANGDFESAFPGSSWAVSANLSGSVLSTTVKHSGNSSLHMVSTSAGSTRSSSIYQDISPALTNGAAYTLSFWYLQSTNGGPFTVRLSLNGIQTTVNPSPGSSGPLFTPGASNSVAASLPVFPPLWINELEPENLTGITNLAGNRAPWLELYNPGTNAVPLDGLYLANTCTNLTQWAFPTGAVIRPGQFEVIFADGQTGLSTTNELHTSFTLTPGAGALALTRIYSNQAQVLDYVNYTNLNANHSYGSFPDGQSFQRLEFTSVTPGTTNNASRPPIAVFINEWLADNVMALADPADGDYEDWFELYNASDDPADLGGYYLTDTLANKFQYQIPNTHQYVIPPHGFLLVWADNETKQNSSSRPDLHVNFKLDKAGEAIGLFAADGSPVDYIVFGAQVTDVPMGRYPDGGSSVYFLRAVTPRSGNAMPPPSITSLGNVFAYVDEPLSFYISAAAWGLPLSYSIDTGAPANASIDPLTGLFTWNPGPGLGPSTNQLTVRVTDQGVPPASAICSFTITRVAVPNLGTVRLNAHAFNLTWPGLAGRAYRIEYKDDLSAASWDVLVTGLPGTGSLMSYPLDTSGAPQRFYRLMVLP